MKTGVSMVATKISTTFEAADVIDDVDDDEFSFSSIVDGERIFFMASSQVNLMTSSISDVEDTKAAIAVVDVDVDVDDGA